MSGETFITDHSPWRGYDQRGCRCEACVAVHNARVRRNRAERLASGNLTHGARSAYDAGCRCTDCKRARREAYLRLKSEYPQRTTEAS